jgi:hypothetical protein
MLTRTRLVVVIALALGGIAFAIDPGGPGQRVPIDVTSGPAEERLRNALTAVHAYVEKDRKPLAALLANVDVPPIPLAAKVIRDSDDPLAVAAKLLAVVRLTAHAREKPDAVAAVDIMIGRPARDRLFQWLDQPERRGQCADENDAQRERTVARGLRATLGDDKPESSPVRPGACTEFYPSSDVDSGPSSNSLSITTLADVGRPYEQAVSHLDPRSWADCSEVWTKTYLVETRNGEPVYENGKPKRKSRSVSRGGAFDGEVLYEQVQCESKCAIELLLDVSATKSADSYRFTYGLRDGDGQRGSPQLSVDRGYIAVKKLAADRLEIEAHKTIGFTGRADGDAALLLLRSIDMNAHLQRLACCRGS